MANMSYCRFENTARDLQDCVSAIDNGNVYDFNEYELNGFEKLIKLAEEIVDMNDETELIIEHYKNQD
jgi:hypothetical protein